MRPGGVGGRLSALRPPRQVHWPSPALRVPPSSGRGGDGGGPPRSPGKRAQPRSALTSRLAPSPTPRPPHLLPPLPLEPDLFQEDLHKGRAHRAGHC